VFAIELMLITILGHMEQATDITALWSHQPLERGFPLGTMISSCNSELSSAI
jgi:hypothetical protein